MEDNVINEEGLQEEATPEVSEEEATPEVSEEEVVA